MPTNAGRMATLDIRRFSRLALLALGLLAVPAASAVSAAPALANSSTESPEYSLSIVEGETTQPEDGIAHISGYVHPRSQVSVSIVRNGIPVAKDTGNEGVWLSQVPQVGDVVTLESPVGTPRGAVVYDGLPAMDATVCAGSANFSGQRSTGDVVEGGYYTVVPHPSYNTRHGGGDAQVPTLSGPGYSGSFLSPLALGETVFAVESVRTPLAGAATFVYSSENDRPVGACPVPPPPPPPPPPLALQGSALKLLRTTIHRLLVSGWLNHVTINQPGTVVEDLYQQGGTVPAYAASTRHKRRRRQPPAVLLARGSVSASAAGTVSVLLRVTSQGRRKLKHAKSVKAVLVTTLHGKISGTTLTLERRTITLHR